MKNLMNFFIGAIKDWIEDYMLISWCVFLIFVIILAIFN
jgi:hypothetical protein